MLFEVTKRIAPTSHTMANHSDNRLQSSTLPRSPFRIPGSGFRVPGLGVGDSGFAGRVRAHAVETRHTGFKGSGGEGRCEVASAQQETLGCYEALGFYGLQGEAACGNVAHSGDG